MHKSKYHLFMTAAILVVLIMAILACSSQATAQASTTQVRYAVYLAPYPTGTLFAPIPGGPQPTVPYGGYHITIVGFKNTVINFNTVRADWLAANNKKLTYSVPLNIPEKDYKKTNKKINYQGKIFEIGYKATFNSPTLTAFKDNLKTHKIVGKEKGRWHVSLYRTSLSAARSFWTKDLALRQWHVFVVQRTGTGSSAKYIWYQVT